MFLVWEYLPTFETTSSYQYRFRYLPVLFIGQFHCGPFLKPIFKFWPLFKEYRVTTLSIPIIIYSDP